MGPLILYRRYKFIMPNFKNQMTSFSTMVIYQLVVLVSIGLLTTVNLNFSLCHSPADPFYQYVGYHYFTGAVLLLNFLSFLGRWITYTMVLPVKFYYKARKAEKQTIGKSKPVKRE